MEHPVRVGGDKGQSTPSFGPDLSPSRDLLVEQGLGDKTTILDSSAITHQDPQTRTSEYSFLEHSFPSPQVANGDRTAERDPFTHEADFLDFQSSVPSESRYRYPQTPESILNSIRDGYTGFELDDFTATSAIELQGSDLSSRFYPSYQQHQTPLLHGNSIAPEDTLQSPLQLHQQSYRPKSNSGHDWNVASALRYGQAQNGTITPPQSRGIVQASQGSTCHDQQLVVSTQSQQKPYTSPYEPIRTQEIKIGASGGDQVISGMAPKQVPDSNQTHNPEPNPNTTLPSPQSLPQSQELPHHHESNEFRWTRVNALQLACHFRNPMIVKLLLLRGASVHGTNKRQQTALHIAASRGHSSVVQVLLQHGVDPCSSDVTGSTPLHIACQNDHRDCARMLLDLSPAPNQRDARGFTALHIAVMQGHIEIVKILLKKENIDLGQRLENGKTALHLAAEGELEDILQLLIDHGADINAL